MTERPHSDEVRNVYDGILAGVSVRSRHVDGGAGARVHILEKGSGPPVVLLPGAGNPAGFSLPLLNRLDGLHVLAADRPGIGLSVTVDLPRHHYREAAVAWLNGLLDALGLEETALVGHSGGAIWAVWYALAHLDRVNRLALIGLVAAPGTRCPVPIRVAATPAVGDLLPRLVPPSPQAMLRFAHYAARERETLARHPDLVDLLVAEGRDRVAKRSTLAELRALVSPFALLTRSGWRRRSRLRPDELRRLIMPTLLVWGEREPLGDVSVARAMTELIPHGRLAVLPTGHGPWLGQPAETAAAIREFVAAS